MSVSLEVLDKALNFILNTSGNPGLGISFIYQNSTEIVEHKHKKINIVHFLFYCIVFLMLNAHNYLLVTYFSQNVTSDLFISFTHLNVVDMMHLWHFQQSLEKDESE